MHGYGIATLVHERTGGDLAIEDAALYQALHRLDRQGLVDAEWRPSENNRRARYYTLTAARTQAAARGDGELAALFPRRRGRAAGRVRSDAAPSSPARRRAFWYLRRRPDVSRPRSTRSCDVIWTCGSRELGARAAPEDARREALRQFGDLEAHAAYCRQQDLGKESACNADLLLEI